MPVLDPVITAAPSVAQATSFSFYSSSLPLTADIMDISSSTFFLSTSAMDCMKTGAWFAFLYVFPTANPFCSSTLKIQMTIHS